jgi:multisubunit Na+/H+ antiporter MnhB subunit
MVSEPTVFGIESSTPAPPAAFIQRATGSNANPRRTLPRHQPAPYQPKDRDAALETPYGRGKRTGIRRPVITAAAVAPGAFALCFGLANSAFENPGVGILAGALAGIIVMLIVAGLAYAIVDNADRKRRSATAVAVILMANLLYVLALAYFLYR